MSFPESNMPKGYYDARLAEHAVAQAAGDADEIARIVTRVRADGYDFFARILNGPILNIDLSWRAER